MGRALHDAKLGRSGGGWKLHLAPGDKSKLGHTELGKLLVGFVGANLTSLDLPGCAGVTAAGVAA